MVDLFGRGVVVALCGAFYRSVAVYFAGVDSRSLDDAGYAVAVCPLFIGIGKGVCASFLCYSDARVFDSIRRCACRIIYADEVSETRLLYLYPSSWTSPTGILFFYLWVFRLQYGRC